MKKRNLCLIALALLFAVGTISGCNGSNAGSSTPSTATKPSESAVIHERHDLYDWMQPYYYIEKNFDYEGKTFRIMHNHSGIRPLPSDTVENALWDQVKKRNNIGEIEWEVYADFQTYISAIATEVMSGMPPDLIWGYPSWLVPAYMQGYFQDIDFAEDFIEKSPFFIPGISKAYKDLTGHTFMFSTELSTEGILYNYDMIKEAGLVDPQELYIKGEWTYDKFKEYCKKLTVEPDIWGCTIGGDSLPNRGDALNFINANGATMTKMVDGKIVQNLDDPRVITALNFVRSLYEERLINPRALDTDGWSTASNLYLSGKAAFWPLGTWNIGASLSQKNPFTSRIVGYPMGPDATNENYHIPNYANTGYAIPVGIKNPEGSIKVYEQLYMARMMKEWVNEDMTELYQEMVEERFESALEAGGKFYLASIELENWGQSQDAVEGNRKNILDTRFDMLGGLGADGIQPLNSIIISISRLEETPAVAIEAHKAEFQANLDDIFNSKGYVLGNPNP